MSATNPQDESEGGRERDQSRAGEGRVSEGQFSAIAETRAEGESCTLFAISDEAMSSHLLGRPWRPSESWPELAVRLVGQPPAVRVDLFASASAPQGSNRRVTVWLKSDDDGEASVSSAVAVPLSEAPDAAGLPRAAWGGDAAPWQALPTPPWTLDVRVES